MGTTSTPYDDVFRTLLTDCSQLIIPVINEIFHEDYTGMEQVILQENEIFLRQQGGEEDKRITDTSFFIVKNSNGLNRPQQNNHRGHLGTNYHLECQSSPDGSMIIRMYEYDSQLALKDSVLNNGVLNVNFPQSAVLYLRHNENTPDVLTLSIHTPGGDASYKIPALKVKKYSIEEIFQKKLLFLIPFYIFTFEDEFDKIEENEDRMQRLKENYADITRRLEALSLAGDIDGYTKQTICEMSERVLTGITHQYEKIQKEVTKIMGGEILEYPAKTFLRQGIEQGRNESIHMIVTNMLKRGMPDEDIIAIAECNQELIDNIRGCL